MECSRFFKIALEVLFPIQCLGCGLEEQQWVCEPCLEKLPLLLSRHCPFCERPTGSGATCQACQNKRSLDGALSMLPYGHPLIQSLIHAWKYQGARELRTPLGRIAAAGLRVAAEQARAHARTLLARGAGMQAVRRGPEFPAALFGGTATLAPVPLHRRKRKERGFNQAEDLARELARWHGSWRAEDLLVRTRSTHAQATLAGSDRITNAQGAFQLAENEPPKGAHLLLIDDVITTASTAEECARVLKGAGAASVWAVTLAYGHPVRHS